MAMDFVEPRRSAAFQNRMQWLNWLSANSWATDRDYIQAAAADIARDGFVDPVAGPVPPRSIKIENDNFRETILADGLKSRERAEFVIYADMVKRSEPIARAYVAEATTPFVGRLRQVFPVLTESEYQPERAADRRRYCDIMHQDAMALSFAPASFDQYVSNEIMEHVPSIDQVLAEARRILRPGGCFIATFPFRYMDEENLQKARLDPDGKPIYLTEPELHFNPLDPDGGSLLFTIPGWDILRQCVQAGFATAHMEFITSRLHAVLGAEIAGVFVMVARA
jgi:hypothetical protein